MNRFPGRVRGNCGAMPRSIWSGSISFGLVNVPVKMYSAIDEQDVSFHYVHVEDDSPIGYEKICKLEGKPVPDDEVAKAYETEKGGWVYMTDDDFEAAEEKTRTIDLVDFVPYDEIDPIYFERTYYLAPDDGAEKPYVLLLRAMEQSGLAGIAKYVMRNKQHLGCLRLHEGVITLEKMFFADEIRAVDEIRPARVSVPAKQVEMAVDLIESIAGDWEPEKYEDTYRERLLEIIRAKQRGDETRPKAEPAEEAAPDLMSALRESVERARRERRGRGRASSRRGGSLSSLTKEELLDRAADAGISGRSKMSKRELVRALERAA